MLRQLGVAFVVFKRYNSSDPDSLPFLTALAHEGRRIASFSPYRPGLSDAERGRIAPFLHNTDTRIDDALERPGPPLEIWQLTGSSGAAERSGAKCYMADGKWHMGIAESDETARCRLALPCCASPAPSALACWRHA